MHMREVEGMQQEYDERTSKRDCSGDGCMLQTKSRQDGSKHSALPALRPSERLPRRHGQERSDGSCGEEGEAEVSHERARRRPCCPAPVAVFVGDSGREGRIQDVGEVVGCRGSRIGS
jgi:hypothetical protein